MAEERDKMKKLIPSKLHQFLILLAIPVTIVCLYFIFIWSPIEKVMGPVQKIFYFHVASAWNAYLAFFIVFLFSLLYLFTKKRKFDLIAGISGEIGVIFTALVLITGPIWARSAWNTWWTWEPRLTTTLILFFLYIAYIVVRKLDMEWQKQAKLSAVVGIIGFLNVPIVHMSITWWGSSLHPEVDSGGGLEPSMTFTLLFSMLTLTLLYIILMQQGLYVERLKLRAKQLKAKKHEKMMK